MNEPMSKAGVQGCNSGAGEESRGSGHMKKDWHDYCCWKFNRNKCNKKECHYDHHCTYCGGWNHGYYNCRKRLRGSTGSDNAGGSGRTGCDHGQAGNAGQDKSRSH